MSTKLIEAVAWGLLHAVWQGALIALAMAGSLRVLPVAAARARYAMACAGLAAMLALPMATVAFMHASTAPSVIAGPVLAQKAGVSSRTALAPDDRVSVVSGSASALLSRVVAPPAAAGIAEIVSHAVARMARWLALGWALGVLIAASRVFAGWRQLRSLTSNARLADPAWQAIVDRLAAKIGIRRPVRLLASAHVDVPSTVGWLRPAVLIPLSVVAGLSARDVELILAHELAHIRRHDFLVNLLQTAAETLLFFHPAVWWLGSVIRTEREACCDDLAVASGGTALAFARALTNLEALRIAPQPALSALGGSLTERVRRLVVPGGRRARWTAGASVIAAGALLLLVGTVATAAVASPEKQPVPQTAATADSGVTAPPMVNAQASVPAPDSQRQGAQATRTPRTTAERNVAGGTMDARSKAQQDRAANVRGSRATSANDDGDDDAADGEDDRSEREDQRAEREEESADARTVVGRDRLTVHQLVALRNADVDKSRVAEFRAMGIEPTVEHLVELSNAGVTSEYAAKMRARFGSALSAEQLVALKNLDVTDAYVQSLTAMGFHDLAVAQVTGARAVGVDEPFLRELKQLGIQPRSLKEATSLAAVGVNSEWATALAKVGVEMHGAKELEELRALDIDASYVQKMKAAGFTDLSVRSLLQLKANDITPEYLESLRGK